MLLKQIWLNKLKGMYPSLDVASDFSFYKFIYNIT